MTKLAIVATVTVKPGTRAEALAALVAHREWCLRDEPGTLQLEVAVPAELDDTIMIDEAYTAAGACKAHWDGASLSARRSERHPPRVREAGHWVRQASLAACTQGAAATG